ncbi:hypothetical protein BGW42_004929 [Actinomortierella wolfii]|nr:hypothetical protein BGW42_004929 [Actinomortierella wolfii]
MGLTPRTDSILPKPPGPPPISSDSDAADTKSSPTVTPVLMLCPSDVTTLFFFVAPKLRTPVAVQMSQSIGSPSMTRSNSLGSGKPYRHRTTSETPPLATRAAVNAASVNHPTEIPPNPRVHKRSSASFSFFGSSAFKSKPPPPSTTERSKNSTAGDVNSGLSFSSTGHHGAGPSPTLSAVRTSSTVQPQMATIEVTTTTRVGLHPETGIATCPTTRATEVQTPSPRESTVLKAGEDVLPEEPVRSASPVQMATPAEDWADEELLPAMKTAIQEIKAVYPGPIKEVPWSFLKASFDPLQEPWALVYVQYPSFQMFQSSQHDAEGKDSSSADADQYPAPSGLALAPPCMAMVMENSAFGAKPRSVTVTTPVLVDQGMDSAGNPQSGLSEGLVVDLDLDVDVSDTDSILMPEDGSSNSIASSISLGIASRQTHDDHHGQLDWLGSRGSRTGHDTLRSNSSQMLSALSSSSSLHSSHPHPRPPVSNGSMRRQRESSPMTSQRSREFEHQWKQKMRQRIRSEYDLPEDVRTVAKAVFRVLREFDIVPMDAAWIYPGRTPYKEEMSIRSLLIRAIEQARLYGSHAAAVSIHHALSVLNSSSILQVLDDAKLVFLLSLPIYHRLQHRSDRMRARILWEAHAHSWHQRVLAAIERRREDLSSLRIKMYYQTCVRPSKAFERSWAVVQVLSKLNHETLQKYMTAEEVELERQHAVEMQKQSSGHVYLPQGNEFDDDDSLDMQDSTDRHTAVCDPHSLDGPTCESPTVRRRDSPSKSRRSSFSTYIDNMAARSYNSQISFLESQMREREKERDRENDKVKKLSSSYTPSQHGSHLLNQYYHVQEPPPPPTPSGASRQQPLHRAGSRQSLGNHIVGSGPRGWPVMFDKDASSPASNTSHSPTPPATDFVMDAREASAAKKWIQDTGINDFLPGEDNFHRFCMEVELVVRGVGLGGTGIQDAGIPQAIQGQPSATLHSSGSDFFVKEVLRFNGAFVPGLGPPPELLMPMTGSGSGGLSTSSSTSTMSSAPPTPTVSSFATSKSSTAAGVAEYLVNSLKGSSSQSGSQNSGSPISGLTTSLQSGGNFGLGSSGNSSKSRLRIRKVAPTLQISSEDRNISLLDDNLPSLGEDDDSIFATPNPGPTYLLYNPPFASATAGPSSSYSSSTTPGNMSLVSLPHQAGQPIKDLDDLLLKIQLKLTSYVLSEWLDVFGGVETDRWFAEFMEDMMLSKSEGESRGKDDDHPPPLSVSSASSRGITPSSSQQEHLKPMSHSNSSINTSLSDVDTTTSSNNRRKVVTRGRSPLMADGHADGTSGRSPSIGTASRTSSSLSNVSAEGCFTISDIDLVYPSCSEGGHANGKFAKIPDTIAASTTQFSTASSVRPGVPNDNMTHRTSRAEMTQPFGSSAQFEPDSNRTRTTPTPSSIQQQQRPPNSGRSMGSHSTEHETERLGVYDVEEAIKSTIMQMEQIKSPFQKLVHLFSLELLVVASLSYPASCSSGGTNSTSLDSTFTNSIFDSVHSLSSLASEGDADDSDRHSYQHRSSRRKRHGSPVPKSYTPGTDAIVNAIEKLFRKPWPFRPRNLFRDMQLIATFIPGSILDLRDDGKAFWDMALAVTSLKKEVVEHLVKRGLELVETEEVAVAKDHDGLGVSGHTHGYYRNDEEERLRMREAVRLFTIGTGGGGGSSTPSSPKSPSTATMVPGTATTALSSSIPIMRSGSDDNSSSRSRRHRHSSSNGGGIGGAASSFTGNVLNGLGIMAGLGSFTSGGGSGRDGNISGGTGGGDPSSATSNVGSTTGSYGSSNGGTGVSTTAAAPVSSQAMEDLNHLHLASGARSGPRPCSCGSEGSSFGRQLMSHFTDGAGGSSCPCHYHHHHHRHTSSTSSNSSVGSFERDRAGHGRHYHPQHHGQPLDSSSSSLTGLDKFNPENVAAAMHWFTLAAAQGDKFSIEYLRHRDMASGMLK